MNLIQLLKDVSKMLVFPFRFLRNSIKPLLTVVYLAISYVIFVVHQYIKVPYQAIKTVHSVIFELCTATNTERV